MTSQNAFLCGCKDATDGTSNSASSQPTSNTSNVSDPSVYDWQAGKCCVRQRLEHIFQNRCFTDIVLVVGQEPHTERIPAHKVLLSAGSRFFEMMFSEDWAPQSNEIQLPDDDPVAISALVRFLYSDDILLTPEIVVSVLNAAKKYNIPPLEKKCINFFSENLCPENAFTVLRHAVFFNEQLMESCLQIIDGETYRAVQSEGFTNIDWDSLCSFLKRDSLTIHEFDLFQAMIRWSNTECARQNLEINTQSQRSVLKEALYLIRFPLMTIDEFSSDEIAESGLLSPDELISMFLYFTKKKPTSIFSSSPRLDQFVVVNRFSTISDSVCTCNPAVERILFQVDRVIQLAGIGLYGSPLGPATYKVSLSVTDFQPNEHLIYDQSHQCNYDGSARKFRVLLDNPVTLSRSSRINLIIEGPDTFCGARGLATVFVSLPGPGDQKVKVLFFSSRQGSDHTNVSKGQIPELLFKL